MLGFCIGELSGIAQEISSNTFEYNTDFNEKDSKNGEAISCRLTFIFSDSDIIVRETNCNEEHGVACNFEGKFSRFQKVKRRNKK